MALSEGGEEITPPLLKNPKHFRGIQCKQVQEHLQK
jgi:hypothetical protein